MIIITHNDEEEEEVDDNRAALITADNREQDTKLKERKREREQVDNKQSTNSEAIDDRSASSLAKQP